ncbi:hypothetical protein EAI_17073 [Harpegnathos saltator]|uniref:Uncharacterized protein n=1 Tax=Harpegnathos saltator TaxID=610380 RepID=E2BM09_HARSA|nr:hypothetical protein EAI_17073 [Harpegnathos saltator]
MLVMKQKMLAKVYEKEEEGREKRLEILNSQNKNSNLLKKLSTFRCKRPLGNVALHLRSFNICTIKKATEELEKRVNQMERKNEMLMKAIAERRSRICMVNNNVAQFWNTRPLFYNSWRKFASNWRLT